MIRARLVRATARFILAVLVFAQGALTFAGCDREERSASRAIAASGQPCHESTGVAAICLAHCLAGDQSVDKPALYVPVLAPAPVLAWRLVPQALPLKTLRARVIAPQAAAPPRIMFQSLAI